MARKHNIKTITSIEQVPDSAPKVYKSSSGYMVCRWHVGRREYLETREHRYVMGVYDSKMHVHHKNGIKNDNRPENLEVISDSEHCRMHNLEVDDSEISRLYIEGYTQPQIGVRLGVGPGTISRSLKRSGVKRKRMGYFTSVNIDDDFLVSAFDAGVRPWRLAKRLNVGGGILYRRYRDLGYSPKSGRVTSSEDIAAREFFNKHPDDLSAYVTTNKMEPQNDAI